MSTEVTPAAHTPTPWRVEFNPTQRGEPATLIMQAGAEMWEKWIAECPFGKSGDTHESGDGRQDCTAAEAQANARLIVRSVNNHAALLALAHLYLKQLEHQEKCEASADDGNGDRLRALRRDLTKFRAIVAAAEAP